MLLGLLFDLYLVLPFFLICHTLCFYSLYNCALFYALHYILSLYARCSSHIAFAISSHFSEASSHSAAETSVAKSSLTCCGVVCSTSALKSLSPSSGSYAQIAFTSLACFSSEYSGATTMIRKHCFTTLNICSMMFRAGE